MTPTEKATEPLPCPFCGRAPAYLQRADDYETSGLWWVAHGWKARDECPATGAGAFKNSREEAVRWWNRRAPA